MVCGDSASAGLADAVAARAAAARKLPETNTPRQLVGTWLLKMKVESIIKPVSKSAFFEW